MPSGALSDIDMARTQPRPVKPHPAEPQDWPIALPAEKADRRQQIRDVALDMFAREGYANVSLRHIGERIGVHAGSLYNHLESKQSLLFELLQDHLEGLLDTVRHRLRQTDGSIARLKIFIGTHIEFQVNQRPYALLTNLELRSLEPRHRQEIRQLLEDYRNCLGEILEAGKRAGLFQVEHTDIAVRGVLGMLSSVAFWFHEGGQQNREQLTEQLSHMVLGALCHPGS